MNVPVRIWAPAAGRVEIVEVADDHRETRHELRAGADAWWHWPAGLRAGTRYLVSLDGGEALPDPGSLSQPDGVRGPSEVVDHEAFPWTDVDWHGPVPLAASVFYECHVGTFTAEGTFGAVTGHLDHLRRLGVTHLELMPVAEFPGRRGWGYDGVFLAAPHHVYGGPDGLKRLVDACHARGLGVTLDVVYNHLGPSGNHLARFGPFFTDRHHTPWGDAVNLDGPGSHQVRRFLLDNALGWFRDFHIDALRLDAVHALADASAIPFLEQLAVETEVLSGHLGRHLALIAESDLNDARIVARREVGGFGLDAQWSDDFHHALHAVLSGERSGYYADFGTLGQLGAALQAVFVHAGTYSALRNRVHGRPVGAVPGWRFLGYLQNHDQIGNRAVGDRLAASLNRTRLLAGAALVACAPFVPMLFMGEEWGATTPFGYFVDHDEPPLIAAVREGRRREFAAFGWDPDVLPDPQDPATAAAAVLDWAEPGEPGHADILAWWTELLALRRRRSELTDGDLAGVEVRVDEAAGWLVVRRGGVGVGVHLGTTPAELPVGPGRVILAAGGVRPGQTLEHGRIEVMPDAVVVVELADGGEGR